MTYKENGFRSIYKKFALFQMNDVFKKMLEDFPNADEANCVIVYGYIDHQAGMTLEVLSGGKQTEHELELFDGCEDRRAFVRIGSVETAEFQILEDDEWLYKRYSSKMKMIKGYDVDDDIETSRGVNVLDSSRHAYYPDDVLVYLVGKGLNPEGCWVNISGIGDYCLTGKLLNDPDQDFGCHEGDMIEFFVQETDENKYICCSDYDMIRSYTADDMEDGHILKEAISIFRRDRSQKNFFQVLEILRDSYVWVPCNAILSEEDQLAFEQMLANADGDPSALEGERSQANRVFAWSLIYCKVKISFSFRSFQAKKRWGNTVSIFPKFKSTYLRSFHLQRIMRKM